MATGFIFGLGLLLMSQVNTVWQLYLVYGVIFSLGRSSIDVVPLTTVARWFVRRRGIMTGFVKMGTGTGQFILPLVANLLILNTGWRNSYLIIGVAVMVLLVVAGRLLRRDPESMGLRTDGDDVAQTKNQGRAETGYPLRGAIRTRQFWTICLANLFALYSLLSITMHIVPHATDIGITPTIAASILATIGGIGILGRFLIGMTIDRIGSRRAMIICFLLLISALLWLQWARDLWMFYLFAAAYGLAHGGIYTMISPIVAEYFGVRAHGVLFGIVAFVGNIGGAVGSVVAGYIFDVTVSYSLAFWICTAVSAVGLGLILSLRQASPLAKEIAAGSA